MEAKVERVRRDVQNRLKSAELALEGKRANCPPITDHW